MEVDINYYEIVVFNFVVFRLMEWCLVLLEVVYVFDVVVDNSVVDFVFV